MNSLSPKPCSPRCGFSLLEMLVYMAVLLVLMTIAFGAYYRTSDTTRQIGRNADDITRALHAGERWRSDVRSAVGALRIDENGGNPIFHVPCRAGDVRYWFREGSFWREADGDPHPLRVLDQVAASRFVAETRAGVVAWRWELELVSPRRHAVVKPLFTFLAAAASQ